MPKILHHFKDFMFLQYKLEEVILNCNPIEKKIFFWELKCIKYLLN